jgi:hypothetical protein
LTRLNNALKTNRHETREKKLREERTCCREKKMSSREI